MELQRLNEQIRVLRDLERQIGLTPDQKRYLESLIIQRNKYESMTNRTGTINNVFEGNERKFRNTGEGVNRGGEGVVRSRSTGEGVNRGGEGVVRSRSTGEGVNRGGEGVMRSRSTGEGVIRCGESTRRNIGSYGRTRGGESCGEC